MKKIVLYSMLFVFISCNEFDSAISGRIKTIEVTEIKDVSAISGGIITFETKNQNGFNQIAQKGIIWGELKDDIQDFSSRRSSQQNNNNPYKDDANDFLCEMTGLKSNTTYYVRAFAQFGKANEENFAYGTIQSFTTSTSNVQVRFRKEKDYDYCFAIGIDSENDEELVWYSFGNESGTSEYYEIPAGNHKPWYIWNNEGDWEYCFSNPITCNFVSGRKYTLVCSDDGEYLTFRFIDDGLITMSYFSTKLSEPIKRSFLHISDKKQNNRIKSSAYY